MVLLLWSSAFVVNEFGLFPATPWVEPPPGDLLDGPWITTDAEYSNMSGILTKWIRVAGPRGRLRLVDCDLVIPLEDMLASGGMAMIEAQGGASIELVRTTIRVVADANLSRAVGTEYDDYRWYVGGGPYLARVVNLRGATHALLSLNVSWRERTSELLVMGAALPEGEFKLLGSLPLAQSPPMAWSHLEFDLTALTGGLARLALAPVSPVTGRMLISDLRVTDGGRPLPHDTPMSGEPHEDGWDVVGFNGFGYEFGSSARPLMSSMNTFTNPATLINTIDPTIVNGNIAITDSTIEFPLGVGRMSEQRVRYVTRSMLLADVMAAAPLGGDVRLMCGHLALSGSHLINVPVSAEVATVDIVDTVLEGDTDLLSLRDAGGTVDRARFVSRAPPPGTPPTRNLAGDFAWAVSAQGSMPGLPLTLKDCRFEGSDVALVLNRTDARVSGCDFRGVTRLAVWDRDSAGLGGWDALATANAFVDCTGHRYLRTTVCELDYMGPNVPYDDEYYSGHDENVVDPVDPVVPDLDLIEGDVLGATLLLPAVAVEGDGTVHAIDAVSLKLRTQWGGDDYIQASVPAGTARTTVVFDLTDGSDPKGWTFDRYIAEGAPIGVEWSAEAVLTEVTFNIHVNTNQLTGLYNVSDIRALVVLDGVLRSDVDVIALVRSMGVPTVHFDYTTTLSGGRHTFEVVLNGTRPGWDAPRGFARRTSNIMRVNASTTSSEVLDFLNETDGVLVLERGSDIVLEHIRPHLEEVPTFYDGPYWGIDAYLAEGSRLVADGVRGNETTVLGFCLEGAGEFELRNATCGIVELWALDACLSVIDSACAEINLYASDDADVRLERTTINTGLEGWYIRDSNLTLEDCHVTHQDVGPTKLFIDARHSTVRLLDSSFERDGPGPFSVTMFDAYRVEVSGCTFMNTGLDVGIFFNLEGTAETFHLDLRDSTFSGDAAYLLVPVYNRGADDIVMGGVSGNTFRGPGAFFAFNHGLLDGLMGDNTLRDGASAHQMLWDWVDARYIDDPDEYHALGHTLLMGDGPTSNVPEKLRTLVSGFLLFPYVTGDPPTAIDQPVTMVLTDQGEVVWFQDSTLLAIPHTVRIQRLPDVDVLVNAIRAPLVEALEWWTD